MINLKDAKETRKKVEEIKAKRNNKKPVEKVITKKAAKRETKQQKEKKKKFRKFLIKFIALEYMICAGLMLIIDYKSLAIENRIKDSTIKTQQETIYKLLNSNEDKKLDDNESDATNIINPTQNTLENDSRTYLGNFKITHYCACKKCCGPNAKGITASGKKVEEGRTIAVDPKIIKLGSEVYIDGYGYMEAQDTGSAIKGNIIDVYVADHQEALNLGVVYKDVYLVK